MTKKLEIDYDVADGITKLCLIESYKLMQENNRDLEKEYGHSSNMPPHRREDWGNNTRMMYHMAEVIKYYGGSV